MNLSRHIAMSLAMGLFSMSAMAADSATLYDKLEQSGIFSVSQPKALNTDKHPGGLTPEKLAKRAKKRAQKSKNLTLLFDDAQSFQRTSASLTSTLGKPAHTFAREHVWYVPNPYRADNGVKTMTLQLKTNRKGQLVLKIDGRSDEERGSPLIIGPQDRFSKKSHRSSRLTGKQSKARGQRRVKAQPQEKFPL